jgi:tetratricopeptide (TPR) repeat protein
LTRADGFALYVAVVKTPAQRNQLISLLGEAVPAAKLQTVIIRAETTDILDEVQKQLGGKPSGPVMVVGLEEALHSDTENQPILNALNLRRPDWPQLVPQPVVFWVPEYLLGILARSAPDFLDWRSDTLHFPDFEPAQFQVLQSATWGRGLDTRMPADTRFERIKELESRIASNEHSNDPGIRMVVADWLNELGLHLKLLGKDRDAIGCFSRVQSIAHNLGYKRGEGTALSNLGIAYTNLGDIRKAVDFYEQALRIARETGDRLGEAHGVGNLGNAYKYMGETYKAIEFYEQSLRLHREIGDRHGEGGAFHNLGTVYAGLGETRKAIGFLDQGLAIFRDIGNLRGEAYALCDLGTVFAELANMRRAIESYEQSLAISRKIGDRRGEAVVLWNSATAFNQLGNRAEAIARLRAALEIFEAIEDPDAAKVRALLAELRK